jgi:N6-L-threonylcarbamoyladenine synthase
VQAAIARQLSERTDRAMKLYKASHPGQDLRFVVAGGVAANGAVKAALRKNCADNGFRSTPRPWPIAPTTPP